MPVSPTYPGLYVEEIPSAVHNIVGVSTANTAFVDFFTQGPMNVATQITSFTEFQNQFGGLDTRSEASYGIMQYYLNGGQTAWVVRVAGGNPAAARVTLESSSPPQPTLRVVAASPGIWGENLQVGIDYNTRPTGLFNLTVRELDSATNPTQVLNSEVYRNLSMGVNDPNYGVAVINNASQLVQITDLGLGELPFSTAADVTSSAVVSNPQSTSFVAVNDPAHPANDGTVPGATELENGVQALARIEPFIFNILCLPAAANLVKSGAPDAVSIAGIYANAGQFCASKRAFMIVDIPASIQQVTGGNNSIVNWVDSLELNGYAPDSNSAIYFPRLTIPDPLNQNRLRNVGVSGTIAGVFASTDASRGVWKSPAGIGAPLVGASLALVMNDSDNGIINPLGINALRNFPIYGNICWGARTMQGADQIGSQWAYTAVRRTALYIEESLFEGLKWVVFEPNDDRLWAQIRLNVTSFMQNLFRLGAFQGTSASTAYFVKCDSETTTQTDINSGIVNILVGFAPLKPAEFVIIQIEQMAGQSAS
jgi:phage tail sheath protein FI